MIDTTGQLMNLNNQKTAKICFPRQTPPRHRVIFNRYCLLFIITLVHWLDDIYVRS